MKLRLIGGRGAWPLAFITGPGLPSPLTELSKPSPARRQKLGTPISALWRRLAQCGELACGMRGSKEECHSQLRLARPPAGR